MIRLQSLLDEIRACTTCVDVLPEGPRPIVQAGATARVVLIGQAPGRAVHRSGIAWDDPSGRRLRSWLGLTDRQFYDRHAVAIVPMGFCYPGTRPSGDLPPRPECAPQWHERLFAELPDDRLVLLIGAHAQARYLPEREATLTATVRKWASHLPDTAVLPHPSPRNSRWLAANPWFESDAVPAIRARVAEVIGGDSE